MQAMDEELSTAEARSAVNRNKNRYRDVSPCKYQKSQAYIVTGIFLVFHETGPVAFELGEKSLKFWSIGKNYMQHYNVYG